MHSKYSKWPSYLFSRTQLLFVALMLTIVLSACSPLDIASSLLGGGPNINGQIGQTNQQGINTTLSTAPEVTVKPKARVGTIDQSTINNTTVDLWVMALLIIGWLAPSPGEIARSIKQLFRRKSNGDS